MILRIQGQVLCLFNILLITAPFYLMFGAYMNGTNISDAYFIIVQIWIVLFCLLIFGSAIFAMVTGGDIWIKETYNFIKYLASYFFLNILIMISIMMLLHIVDKEFDISIIYDGMFWTAIKLMLYNIVILIGVQIYKSRHKPIIKKGHAAYGSTKSLKQSIGGH